MSRLVITFNSCSNSLPKGLHKSTKCSLAIVDVNLGKCAILDVKAMHSFFENTDSTEPKSTESNLEVKRIKPFSPNSFKRKGILEIST